MPAFNPDISTNANLRAFGFTTRPAARGPYRKDVLDASGRVVFTGNAHEATAWLKRGAPVAE